MEKLITIPKVAVMLNISPQTVREMLKLGQLKAVRIGKLDKVKLSEVEAFLK